MTRPVIETCWKKTYLMPSASMRRAISSIFSRRPGWLRASSSVAGGGAIRARDRTGSTVPPSWRANAPPTGLLVSVATLSPLGSLGARAGRYRSFEQIGTFLARAQEPPATMRRGCARPPFRAAVARGRRHRPEPRPRGERLGREAPGAVLGGPP